MTEDQD